MGLEARDTSMSGPRSAVDTVRRVETPEGVELQLRPAGPVVRALALGLDQIIVWAGLFLAMIPLAMLNAVGMGIWLILLFLAQWLYPVLFEVLGSGQTPGKRAFRLRVLMEDGLPITWRPSLLRNLLRVVDALPAAYTVGLLACFCSRNFQRLGDQVAGTLVVHVEPGQRPQAMPEVPALNVPQVLTLDEQSALLDFGTRSLHLNPARAEELADILRDFTGKTGAEGVCALQGMARHIRGLA